MNTHARQVASLMKADGVTKADAELLISKGIPTLAHAHRAGKEALLALKGIGESKASALAGGKKRIET